MHARGVAHRSQSSPDLQQPGRAHTQRAIASQNLGTVTGADCEEVHETSIAGPAQARLPGRTSVHASFALASTGSTTITAMRTIERSGGQRRFRPHRRRSRGQRRRHTLPARPAGEASCACCLCLPIDDPQPLPFHILVAAPLQPPKPVPQSLT
jgi:hypothetical protein